VPADDVGRNDPCPCGSGAKYKYCCLRKKKHQRSRQQNDEGASWREEFKKLHQEGIHNYGARPVDIIIRLTKAWELVEQRLEPSDTSPRDVENRLGFPEAESLKDLLDLLAVKSVDAASAGDADPSKVVDMLETFIDQFPDMDEELADWLHQMRVEALTHAGRYDEALERAQQLIDRKPDTAVGYVLAADALKRNPDRDEAGAVEYLEEANSKEDAPDWDVEARLNHLVD